MRKLVAVAMAVIFGLVLPTISIAKSSHKGTGTPHVSGTITSWDDTAKQATVKESSGKEISFGWNDATKLTGTPKVGEHASVSYTKDKEGKRTATHITIGAKTAEAKPAAPK